MFCKCRKPTPAGAVTLWGKTYVRCAACDEPIRGTDRYISAMGQPPKGQRPKSTPVEEKQPRLL